VSEPFADGVASVLVAPAVTADGQEVVLKVQDPHRESEHEAAALQLWDGDGAVRLLDQEPEEFALLLERCVPGTPLSAAGPSTSGRSSPARGLRRSRTRRRSASPSRRSLARTTSPFAPPSVSMWSGAASSSK